MGECALRWEGAEDSAHQQPTVGVDLFERHGTPRVTPHELEFALVEFLVGTEDAQPVADLAVIPRAVQDVRERDEAFLLYAQAFRKFRRRSDNNVRFECVQVSSRNCPGAME